MCRLRPLLSGATLARLCPVVGLRDGYRVVLRSKVRPAPSRGARPGWGGGCRGRNSAPGWWSHRHSGSRRVRRATQWTVQASMGDGSQKCADAAKAMNSPERDARAHRPTWLNRHEYQDLSFKVQSPS